MKYKVKIERTDEGYAIWCPGLPGCWSQGRTEEEALENIKDAIETYLATVEELTRDKETRQVEIPAYGCPNSPESHIVALLRRSKRLDFGLYARESTYP